MPTISYASSRTSRPTERVVGLRVVGINTIHRFQEKMDTRAILLIGRTRQRDIRIHHSTVSRKHCSITIEGGYYVMRDLDSENGIRVSDRLAGNYRRVVGGRLILEMGQFIRLGDAIVVPVNTDGRALIAALRLSEFLRAAIRVYGSMREAAARLGDHDWFWRITKLFNRMARSLI